MRKETEFGEKLRSVLESIDSLTWRDKSGNDVKLVDASVEDLRKWYKHCYEMLYNVSPWNPGKFIVRENIHRTWDSCNTELFVRYILHECETDIKTKLDILDYINKQRAASERDILNDSIASIFNGVPPIFEKVTVNRLMDACFDKLDVLNKKIELTEVGKDGKARNRMEVIKERLCLNPDIKLRVSPTGLSFTEFRSLVQLSSLPKISSLTTIALKTLRDKILLLLDNDLDYHINKWSTLMSNIQRVADARNIEINPPAGN